MCLKTKCWGKDAYFNRTLEEQEKYEKSISGIEKEIEEILEKTKFEFFKLKNQPFYGELMKKEIQFNKIRLDLKRCGSIILDEKKNEKLKLFNSKIESIESISNKKNEQFKFEDVLKIPEISPYLSLDDSKWYEELKKAKKEQTDYENSQEFLNKKEEYEKQQRNETLRDKYNMLFENKNGKRHLICSMKRNL